MGMKNIEAREPPIYVRSRSLLEVTVVEEAQHNERVEWIRTEERRQISNMDWEPIHIMEIT